MAQLQREDANSDEQVRVTDNAVSALGKIVMDVAWYVAWVVLLCVRVSVYELFAT